MTPTDPPPVYDPPRYPTIPPVPCPCHRVTSPAQGGTDHLNEPRSER